MIKMFTCKECRPTIKQFTSIKALLLHLELKHSLPASGKFVCGEGSCCRKFDSVDSFRRHLQRFHNASKISKEEVVQPASGSNVVMSSPASNASVNCGESVLSVQSESSEDIEEISLKEFQSAVSSQADAFVAKLYSKPGLPRNHVQHMINDTHSFLSNGFVAILKSATLKALQSSGADISSIKDIQSMFDIIENPFTNHTSEYKRLKYFQTLGFYVPSESYVLGKRLQRVKTKGIVKSKWLDVSAEFVPLRSVLKKFLELPNAFREIMSYVTFLKNDTASVQNFMQGKLWKMKVAEYSPDDIVLPLFLYFDDFEANNPLGPHSGKVGGVYVSLPCLPPPCQSSLENIFLALLFNSYDRQEFGNEKVFGKLINELNFLANDGILIHTSDQSEKRVFFCLGLIVGDNLGIHQICGLVESFSANHPCRFCKIHKKDLRHQTEVNASCIRNVENYKSDVQECNATLTGIQSECVFNNVTHFHITSNFHVDVMHDLAEGVLHYVMIFLLNQWIKRKTFTLAVLNFRLQTFDFGFIGNKPPCISEESLSKSKLKMTASEALNFTRFFGVLMGDLVLESDQFWPLYITLQHVLLIVFSKSMPTTAHKSLRVLIVELCELYLQFGNSLKPKFHHLLHYSVIFEMAGPYVHFSSMRFEAKHRQLKQSAEVNMSRVNISKSLAVKHQLNLCFRFLARKGILPDLETGPGDYISLDTLLYYEDFVVTLPHQVMREEMSLRVNWIDYNGTRFSPEMVLICDFSISSGFLFGCIKYILVRDEVPFFLCKKLKNLGFNEHVNAYEVLETDNWLCVTSDDLLDPLPVSTHSMANGETFVVLRYCL